jgi:hypothetical protein
VPQNREIWSDDTFQYCGPPLQIGLLHVQINMVHVLQSSLYGLLRLPYLFVRNFLNSNCRLCCKVLALKHLLVVLLCVLFFLVGIWINFMIKFPALYRFPTSGRLWTLMLLLLSVSPPAQPPFFFLVALDWHLFILSIPLEFFEFSSWVSAFLIKTLPVTGSLRPVHHYLWHWRLCDVSGCDFGSR